MSQPTVFYFFPDEGVTAVDVGGPHLDIWNGGPEEAAAPDTPPFDTLNVYDYRAGRRQMVTRELVEELMLDRLEGQEQ